MYGPHDHCFLVFWKPSYSLLDSHTNPAKLVSPYILYSEDEEGSSIGHLEGGDVASWYSHPCAVPLEHSLDLVNHFLWTEYGNSGGARPLWSGFCVSALGLCLWDSQQPCCDHSFLGNVWRTPFMPPRPSDSPVSELRSGFSSWAKSAWLQFHELHELFNLDLEASS